MRETWGWVVLAGVFGAELLAIAAAAVWGAWADGLWLALVAAGLVVVVWGLFASPRAPYAPGPVRPVTKVLVFRLAAVGLWVSGHPVLAACFVVFVLAVHALARLPFVRDLTPAV
ncbi:MAG: DUF2568 domain-containing protein [Nocardioidaceae bacterium]